MALFDLDAIPALIGKVIDRVIPDPVVAADAKLKVATLAQNGELEVLRAETSLAMGQIEINKIEAASSSKFVAGGRPFVMWVCGFSLAYAALIEPIARFVASVIFKYAGTYPAINTDLTLQVLMALLGLGVMRSVDKKNGVAR